MFTPSELPPKSSTAFPNSATIWGPSVLTRKPNKDILHTNHSKDVVIASNPHYFYSSNRRTGSYTPRQSGRAHEPNLWYQQAKWRVIYMARMPLFYFLITGAYRV